ncbi:MAG: hypothetical protein HFE78_07385 [Clostridiales bacterium]|nr:hypothetical protein [Clostridiales bacterium]
MREILFRGKRKDNGEWVEGNLFFDPDLEKYTIFGYDYYTRDYALQREELMADVTAETVGQYTGLTDKNGVKIFEGDILKHDTNCPIEEYRFDYGYVFWYGEAQRYLRTSLLYKDDCCKISGVNRENYEVVGNIYNNPELLEGESDGTNK